MNILSIILRVVAIGGAIAATVFYVQIGNTKQELEDDLSAANTNIQGLQSDLSAAEADLTSTRANLQDTEKKLEETQQARRKYYEQAIAAEKAAKNQEEIAADLRSTLKDRDDRIERLQKELIASNEQAQQASPEKVAELETTIEEREDEIRTLEEKVRELQTEIDNAPAAPAMVASNNEGSRNQGTDQAAQPAGQTGSLRGSSTPSATTAAAGSGGASATTPSRPAPSSDIPAFAARVLGVSKDNSSIAINLGAEQGAQPAMELRIQDGAKRLAIVRLSEVQEDFSIAQVIELNGRVTTDQNVLLVVQ